MGISEIRLRTSYYLTKKFGKEVRYNSFGPEFGGGEGETIISNKPLWSEGYMSCCGTILLSDNLASLSHRNSGREQNYKVREDLKSTLNEMLSIKNNSQISGFAAGGSLEHLKQILEGFNELGIVRIGDGIYHNENCVMGLAVIPRTKNIILCKANNNSKINFINI
ncbi:hypothetical protein HY449_04135 [Candidatus Pacearchaeota archaeon]|nr:hypothetical protein [Candidatus Pacearchaeota archaeon]